MNPLTSLRKITALAVMVLVVIAAARQCVMAYLENCAAEPIVLRNISDHESLSNTWKLEGIYLPSSKRTLFMVANNTKLIGYASTRPCGSPYQLITFDKQNGEVLKKGARIPAYAAINGLIYDEDKLYIGYSGRGQVTTDSIPRAGGVIVYEDDLGDILWKRTIPGAREIRSLAIGNDLMVVDGGGFSSYYYILDSNNGNVITKLEKLNLKLPNLETWASYALLSQHLRENEDYSVANDTKDILFWMNRLQQVEQPPIFLDNKIITRTNLGEDVGQIKVLARETGGTIWQTSENIVSNVAVDNGHAFYLTTSGTILGVDINTGEQIGFVQFTGGNIKMEEERGFYIAVNDNNIFVYFGDSRQLFAFEFIS